MEYVIIGNSAAAVGAIEGIRSVDAQGKITVVSDEAYPTYSRPLISYLLLGKTTEEKMKYRPADFYEKNQVELLLRTHAEKIDPTAKTVLLEDGRLLSYDKLLIAAGSSPLQPPIPGLEQVEAKCTFGSLDDAKALEKLLTKETRLLIMGAGLIGLKCAEGVTHLAGSVDVVDLAPHVLPSILDEKGAALVQAHMEQKGVRFILGDSVKSFAGNTATLASGRQLDFDVLVIAVGVRPNTALVEAAGGQVQRGICTDETQKTTLPDIYAAGDCTLSRDLASGEKRILALLPNAYAQGECAGINMAGGSKRYEKAIAMNAIGFWGLHVLTAGAYNGTEYIVESEGNYKKLIVRDNHLVGYILVGDVRRAGIYTALIKNQTPLDTLDFDLILEKPQLMAFSYVERQKMLARKA